jgi:hypothetical protein
LVALGLLTMRAVKKPFTSAKRHVNLLVTNGSVPGA